MKKICGCQHPDCYVCVKTEDELLDDSQFPIEYKGRVTPHRVTELKRNELFVFGSNLAGRHGAGAALLAYRKFGATYGKGYGRFSKSFAIPTKDKQLKTRSLFQIAFDVASFIRFAELNGHLTFLVTEIGCGLAGYKPVQIAPLFRRAIFVHNIHLPKSFWRELL